MNTITDTIAAMATSPGESGIGIIRISGSNACAIADVVFTAASGARCAGFKSFTTHYGWVADKSSAAKKGIPSGVIDEALLTVMRAPKSYTREDVVEINCHGGIAAMRAVLDLVLENGCRLAEPGEFTKRAFLNGRIDLSQAEAVCDVINAKTDAALRIGMGQLQGQVSRSLNRMRAQLLDFLVTLEAAIDFPEEEAHRIDLGKIRSGLKKVGDSLDRLLAGCERGKIYREGIHVVICGKPNAGKSSLLNAILKEERAIVTSVAGTTRDAIEEMVDIRGIPVRITDTAGVGKSGDMIEKKAMAKTQERIESADIIILMFDGSAPLDSIDLRLIRQLAKKKRIIPVINKIDLKAKIAQERIRTRIGEPVMVCAKSGRNIGTLEEAIAAKAGCVESAGPVLVNNLRQIIPLKKMKKIIEETVNCRDNEVGLECWAQNIKDACALLDQVQGKVFSEELLDKIFSRFCVGK